MKKEFHLSFGTMFVVFFLFLALPVELVLAVNSKVTRHANSADFMKGEPNGVVIGSQGTLGLGQAATVLAEKFDDVWSINSIVVNAGVVYLGTSPNGSIYKYSLGKLEKIYPLKSDKSQDVKQSGDNPDPADAVEAKRYLSNEHIFAMATDVAGRLLVGLSGDKCALCRLEAGRMKTIYEPNDAKYIFAIALDDKGAVYLGTGPQGRVYRLDSLGREPQLIYQSRDKNILSLAVGEDGFLYAGGDGRGLIYKINLRTKTAAVLYDSGQQEIMALQFAGMGDLYAAATSAQIAQAKTKFVLSPLAGRPESQPEKQKSPDDSDGGLKLKIANTRKETDDKQPQAQIVLRPAIEPGKASYIYKVTGDGYVTDVFTEAAVFFCMAEQDGKLLVGTGNNARLFSVDPALENDSIVYKDEQASQITAIAVAGADVYLGTANPAKLIKLESGITAEGTYTSELIDAGQPAKWGKLQIEADIPAGCKVLAASRSGNVKDVNDPTFSQWTEPVEVTEPVQLLCPVGRFCQYKLVMRSGSGKKSPIVREIAVAQTIPNMAPKVESVSIARIEAAGKTGILKISYKAKDDNNDKLIYRIDFRKIGRTSWIELKKELEADSYEWDGKTVEDGRYEVRITASDERSNATMDKLTGSRVSEPVVVDNTGPVIQKYSIESTKKAVTLKLHVSDELSAIGQLQYTVDSDADWKSTVPDDLVYDTTEEDFTIVIEDLKPGEHVIALKISDDIGNTTYKTFEVGKAEN